MMEKWQESSDSLGLRRLKTLTTQLDGTMDVSCQNGTTFTVIIPKIPNHV